MPLDECKELLLEVIEQGRPKDSVSFPRVGLFKWGPRCVHAAFMILCRAEPKTALRSPRDVLLVVVVVVVVLLLLLQPQLRLLLLLPLLVLLLLLLLHVLLMVLLPLPLQAADAAAASAAAAAHNHNKLGIRKK